MHVNPRSTLPEVLDLLSKAHIQTQQKGSKRTHPPIAVAQEASGKPVIKVEGPQTMTQGQSPGPSGLDKNIKIRSDPRCPRIQNPRYYDWKHE